MEVTSRLENRRGRMYTLKVSSNGEAGCVTCRGARAYLELGAGLLNRAHLSTCMSLHRGTPWSLDSLLEVKCVAYCLHSYTMPMWE